MAGTNGSVRQSLLPDFRVSSFHTTTLKTVKSDDQKQFGLRVSARDSGC